MDRQAAGSFIYLSGKHVLLRKAFLLFLLGFFIFFKGFSQTASCSLRISLLTCSPGEELYSTFGHSALRVTDSTTGQDIIYNYGTFEFGPDFYTKFIKGKLLYFVSTESFQNFVGAYQWESRSIVEQELNLNCGEKEKLYNALKWNALEENKYYRYDFLFDNCSSRLRDIVSKNTSSPVRFGNILPEKVPSFRDLIHSYLDRGGQYWSKFGIDILLGSRLDEKVKNEQTMFLPDYLMKGFGAGRVEAKPLAAPVQNILQMPAPEKGNSLFQPMIIFSMLLLIILVLSFIPRKSVQTFLHVFDFLFFFFLGLTGILLLFMWFGTDHTVARDNFNLLWALPTHALAAFFLWKPGKKMHYYLLVTIIFQAFLLIAWIFLPQELNLAFLPIILLVLLRSWLIILKPHAHADTKNI